MAVLVALSLSSQAWALNGYFSHGYGSKSKAMGGTGVAFGQDALAAATNPANLVFVDDRLDIGLALLSPPRSYESSPSSRDGNGGAFTIGPQRQKSDRDFFLIPNFGINWKLDEVSAFGISAYGNGGNTEFKGGTATFDPDGPDIAPVSTLEGTFGAGKAGLDFIQTFLNLSYARKINERFAVGAGLLLAGQTFEIQGVRSFAPLTETSVESGGKNQPSNLSNNNHDYSFGAGLRLGATLKLHPALSVAASYQTKTYMTRLKNYSDFLADNGHFDIPATGTIGLALRPSKTIALTFDIQKIWYSDVDVYGNDSSALFDCPSLGGSDVESCFGGRRGPGLGWDDQTIYKVGLQWEANPYWTWRLGYSKATNPVNRENVFINILSPGITQEHYTGGLTHTLGKSYELSIAGFYLPEEKFSGRNSFDPTQTITIEHAQYEIETSFAWKW